MRPVLLLDVDGVLNACPSRKDVHARVQQGYRQARVPDLGGHTWPFLVHPKTPQWLGQLGETFDIRWCTTWSLDDDPALANRRISRLVGLPGDLPSVRLPVHQATDGNSSLFWKTKPVFEWAKQTQRPFVWLDDDVSKRERTWLQQRLDVPLLTVRTEPGRGLQQAQVDLCLAFAQSVAVEGTTTVAATE